MALNFKKMEKILNDTFFSIKFFNEEGFEKVSDITGIDYDEIVFEYDCGNFLVGQSFSGRFYLFSDSDKPENEITFNSFIRLVEKAIA